MATHSKKSSFSKFWLVFFILVTLAIVLIIAGLMHLWQVMLMYEQSTPNYALQNFETYFEGEQYALLAQNSQIKDNPYEPNSTRSDVYTQNINSGELSFGRLATGNTSVQHNYQVKAGDNVIGGFKLVFVDEGMFGYWQITEPTITQQLWGEVTVRLPQTSQLNINGVTAQADLITQNDIPYDMLSKLPEDITQPYKTEYSFTDLTAQPTVSIISETGEETIINLQSEAPWIIEEQNSDTNTLPQYYGNTTLPQPNEDITQLEEMAFEDAENYSRYLSNDNTFSQLSRRLLPDSQIYSEMRSMETMFYTEHTRVSFDDATASNFTSYSNDIFSVDMHYTYTVYRGENRPYEFDTNIALVYVRYDDSWRIGDIRIIN